MTRRFLALGEAMIELSPQAGANTLSWGFAGDSFNTAWYAARLFGADWQVQYFTAIGTDQMSAAFLDFAAAAGIGSDDIITRPDRTLGLYMIHLDQGERSFSYWRDSSAARLMADSGERLARVFDRAEVIYFSGITIAILDSYGRQNLRAALQRARAGGKKIVFDPNLRPGLWPSNAEMCQTVRSFAECADVILPSFEDEQQYFGDNDTAATAARYQQLGAALVVVKNGGGEMLIRQGDAEHRFTPEPVAAPVDTTAAGDSFNAGFLAAYLSGAPLDASVQQASALAARVIAARGALIDGAVAATGYR